MKNASEYANTSLELLVLKHIDWTLGVSTSISIGITMKGFCKLLWRFVVEGNNIFTNSLLGTTIQDSDKRERNNNDISILQ